MYVTFSTGAIWCIIFLLLLPSLDYIESFPPNFTDQILDSNYHPLKLALGIRVQEKM